MKNLAENMRRLRQEKGYSQQQLARMVCVDRSSIARWESGLRVPDLILLSRLAGCLGVDLSVLLQETETDMASRLPVLIMLDDEKSLLDGNMRVLSDTLPGAEITGFTKPSEALSFVRFNHVDIAFLDIEMGRVSGLDVCDQMTEIDPALNVIFLTAYPEYSLRAWESHACGFLLKPLIPEDIRKQLTMLRHPVSGLMQTRRAGENG